MGMRLQNTEVRTGRSHILSAGGSMLHKRVYRDASLLLNNTGIKDAKLTVLWLNDVHEDGGESQFSLHIPPGSTIEFEPPQNEMADQFLDTIVLDHISGSDVEVCCMIPLEQLN